MNTKQYIYTLLSLFLVSCSKDIKIVPDDGPFLRPTAPSGPYVPDNSFKIIAYYSGTRSLDSIDAIKFKMITHVNYAFLYPNADGTLKPLDQPERFYALRKIAKDNGIKMAAALAGPEAVYAGIATNEVLRRKLIRNIMNFAIENELDGIDMDWEYPRSNKSQDITFELLMSELADSLHHWHKFLSAAVTPAVYVGGVRDGINAAVINKVDFLNIMVYDGATWDADEPRQHSSYKMAETSLDIWLNAKGLPKEKTILGVPAYGKNTANAAIPYRDLIAYGASPTVDSFKVENSAYYFNGVDLMKKKALLAKSSANGIMMWEFYQDANGQYSLMKAINDALGRKY